MTPNEEKLIDNVINKLQIHMEQNKQNLHSLAAKMGFAYQPFYRLLTKRHLPTINSLDIIAKHLNCTLGELVHEDIFTDLPSFNNINNVFTEDHNSTIRMYLSCEQFAPLMNAKFFAVKFNPSSISESKEVLAHYYQIFYCIDSVNIDGIFLINYKAKNILLDVLSISSKFIVTEIKGEEVKIDVNEIKPIGKFFNYLTITEQNILTGAIK